MAGTGGEPREPVTQAGIWADDQLRSDIWAAGAVFLVAAFLVGVLIGPRSEVEQAQEGRMDLAFGALAAVGTAIVALWPGRRMPDWAIGLRGEAEPQPPLQAPLVLLGWALAAIAALTALLVVGFAGALGTLAIAVVAPLALARSISRFLERATRTREWASARDCGWEPEVEVPESTPLLRDGTYRYGLNGIGGELGDGLSGCLFHLAVVTIEDSPDGSSESTSRYTALAASVPSPGKRLPVCVCAPRSRLPGGDAYEAWRRKLIRLDLESSEFERRFELAIDRKGDEVWARRLFEPTFLERMTELAQGRLGWELEAGHLTVYEKGFVSDPASLEQLVELAAIVSERVRSEVAETGSVRSGRG